MDSTDLARTVAGNMKVRDVAEEVVTSTKGSHRPIV
ncbi:MAG: hypothetical protein JWN68_3243 [Nocardioides sp.]|jgi:hypothetical protein|nr:hypothetical protein [Nocardioides sp.]